jgi:uncharacterized membrane protein
LADGWSNSNNRFNRAAKKRRFALLFVPSRNTARLTVNQVDTLPSPARNLANTPTEETNMSAMIDDEKTRSNKTLTTVIYALYAASLFVGISGLVAIVMNYVKKEDVAGTILESHFRWQIRTFWFGLLWAVLGGATFVLVVGWFILFADLVWFIYRIVKGWLRLNENKPMYADSHAPTAK